VAEEVEKADPDLVVRDKEGKPYSVRYDQINAMLLNEFLKAHRKMEAQDRKIHQQEAKIAELQSGCRLWPQHLVMSLRSSNKSVRK
jgi:trimeric autotransporter adhesin